LGEDFSVRRRKKRSHDELIRDVAERRYSLCIQKSSDQDNTLHRDIKWDKTPEKPERARNKDGFITSNSTFHDLGSFVTTPGPKGVNTRGIRNEGECERLRSEKEK